MGYKKAFPQIVTYILQKAFFKHALEHSLIFIFARALRQLQSGKLGRQFQTSCIL